MRKTFLISLAASCSILSTARAEDVECVFRAVQQVDKAGTTRSKPFGNCFVYAFWAETVGGGLVYKHFPDSPSKTTDKGHSTYKFEVGKVYYIYFSGSEAKLNDAQIKRLANNGDTHLVRLYVVEQENNEIKVEKVGDKYSVTLQYSFPLWISHLHRLESELKKVGVTKSEDVLSKVRRLYYPDDNWEYLISHDVNPIYEREGDKIVVKDAVPFETWEAIAYRYDRVGDTFILHENSSGDLVRMIRERFDFVQFKTGYSVQIGHVLTGVESYMFPNSIAKALMMDSVAAATWSGDLGQVVVEAAVPAWRQREKPPLDREWNMAVQCKGPRPELIGDVIGAGGAKSIESSIKDTDTLSEALEDRFFEIGWPKKCAENLLQHHQIDLKKEREARQRIRSFVKSFANWWAILADSEDWHLIPSETQQPTLERSEDYFISILTSLLENDIPELTVAPPEVRDFDFDGLTLEQEAEVGTSDTDADRDKDGLWDGWEVKQRVDELEIDLSGADPLVPDVYVQVNWMKSVADTEEQRKLIKEALQLVVVAFSRKRGGFNHKDGVSLERGINLHLIFEDDAIADVTPLETQSFLGNSKWDDLVSAAFQDKKRLTHRHALLALELEGGTVGDASGQAFVINANVFGQSNGSDDKKRKLAARFMGYLGRTMGLGRGGLSPTGQNKWAPDTTSHKPNHISVMNDNWSLGIPRRVGGEDVWIFDFQDFDIPLSLNDLSLDEKEGIGLKGNAEVTKGWYTLNRGRNADKLLPALGSIDWNDNGEEDAGIWENLNGRWLDTSYTSTLREWDKLNYETGHIGSRAFFLSKLNPVEPEEPLE